MTHLLREGSIRKTLQSQHVLVRNKSPCMFLKGKKGFTAEPLRHQAITWTTTFYWREQQNIYLFIQETFLPGLFRAAVRSVDLSPTHLCSDSDQRADRLERSSRSHATQYTGMGFTYLFLWSRFVFVYFDQKEITKSHPCWRADAWRTCKVIKQMTYRHGLHKKQHKDGSSHSTSEGRSSGKKNLVGSPPHWMVNQRSTTNQSVYHPVTVALLMLGWCSWHWRPCSRPGYRWGRPPPQWIPKGRSRLPVVRG